MPEYLTFSLDLLLCCLTSSFYCFYSDSCFNSFLIFCAANFLSSGNYANLCLQHFSNENG